MCVYIYSDAPSRTVTGNTEATGEEGGAPQLPLFSTAAPCGFWQAGATGRSSPAVSEAGGCLWFLIGLLSCTTTAKCPGMTWALLESHLKKGEKCFLSPPFPAERKGSGIASPIHEKHSDLLY